MKHSRIIKTALAASMVLLCWTAAAQANWSAMTNSSTATLRGVWGSSGTNVFAVGENATILKYDGTSWSSLLSGGADLNGVWGSSATNVFAGGGGNSTILKYDGSNWSGDFIGGNYINGLWGSSATDVFAVSADGSILHNDGSTWSLQDASIPVAINGIWGSSATDVYAAGAQNATGRHYDGSTWSVISPEPPELFDVWGSSATNIFTVGDNATIRHYNGSSWGAMARDTTAHLNGVWGSSASDVFAVGANATILHYDGSSWSAMASDATASLLDVWGSACTDVFAVGEGGEILHYDGEALTVTKSGTGSGAVASDTAGIDCGSACSYQSCYGASVKLTATADNGSTFTGWSGGGCTGTGTCTVTMDNATTVSAAFTADNITAACELKIIPKKIHKLFSIASPIKGFMLIGDDKTVFTKDDKPSWGTEGITTLVRVRLGNRTIVALVLVNPFALTEGTFDVTVGDCAGTLEIKKI